LKLAFSSSVATVPTVRAISSSHDSSEWAAFDGLDYDRSLKTEGIIARRLRRSRRELWPVDRDTLPTFGPSQPFFGLGRKASAAVGLSASMRLSHSSKS
jgi:hypothetical protein